MVGEGRIFTNGETTTAHARTDHLQLREADRLLTEGAEIADVARLGTWR